MLGSHAFLRLGQFLCAPRGTTLTDCLDVPRRPCHGDADRFAQRRGRRSREKPTDFVAVRWHDRRATEGTGRCRGIMARRGLSVLINSLATDHKTVYNCRSHIISIRARKSNHPVCVCYTGEPNGLCSKPVAGAVHQPVWLGVDIRYSRSSRIWNFANGTCKSIKLAASF